MGVMAETNDHVEGDLGRRLRGARLRRGWTREELAVRAGVSWSGIAQIESGRRRNVRPGTLVALARVLEVSTDYLIDGGLTTPVMLTHQALLYDSDEAFVDTVGPFLAEGLERGDPALLVTSDANIELIRQALGRQRRQVEYVRAAELYTEPHAALAAYQGFVDRELRGGAQWTRIVGEPVWANQSKAQVRRWCGYESLLNLAFAALPVTLICPYDEREVPPSIRRQACETHPETIMDGRTITSSEYVQPGTFVLGGAPGSG
jgi:transcriptional regulator with XRE-family HTH domain